MTNAFERHGIGHLSASSVNLFAAEPALWVMERLLKRRGKVGASAHRGTACEAGIAHGLLNPDAAVEDCQAIALAEYDRLTALSGDPRRTKEREGVAPIVATGLAELRQYGIPDEVQRRVDVTLPDVPVPFLGFADFGWSNHGLTLDLKTQLRLASEISASHARQVALYIHNTNREARVAYVTPAKIGVYLLTDGAAHVAALANIARRMERLLSISNDAEEIAACVVPDFDSFYWSDPATRALGREVFGF
jgi:hypothetical protein